MPKIPILLASNQAAEIGGVGEAGEAEERRVQLEVREVLRLAGAEIGAIGGPLDRDHAAQDVGARLRRRRHVAQGRLRMGVGVVGERVALGEPRGGRGPGSASTLRPITKKVARTHCGGERVEHLRRVSRVRDRRRR